VRPAERVLRASGAQSDTAFALGILGRTAARAGQPAAALRLLEEARASYLKAGERYEAAATEVSIAEALVYAGQAAAALARVEEMTAAGLARPGQPNASALARVRGFALARLGHLGEARQALAESLEAARGRGDAYDEALAADALLRLAATGAEGETATRGQGPDPGLPARRDELFSGLGLVSVPTPGPAQPVTA
jgi:tetratricopeptide (TPR) repeat protein